MALTRSLVALALLAVSGSAQSPGHVARARGSAEETVQAGQLLDVRAPRGATGGSITAPGLTGGTAVALGQLEEADWDAAGGRLTLRVPPREPGPLTVRFDLGAGRSLLRRYSVLPPNLYDGVRVDGVVDAFEQGLVSGRSASGAATVPMFDTTTFSVVRTSAVDWSVAVDVRTVYLRVTWTDPTEDRDFDLNLTVGPQSVDELVLELDSDGDGQYGTGDDQRVLVSYATGSGLIDNWLPMAASSTGDTVADGEGRLDYDPARGAWTAELLLPRTTDPFGQDAALGPGSAAPFNLVFYDGVGASATHLAVGGLFGLTEPDASAWGTLPLPPELPAAYAPVAQPSGGTLVVVSDHEDPKGELYEVDLPTGSLQRLTNNTLFEDLVSVSPAGDFVAYTQSPDEQDYANWEIARWDRATGLETHLTTNQLLEGHPAVSPDGSRIAFARLGSTGFDIVDMDSLGGPVSPITNNPTGDNDPEWTKGGDLVIKTKRWTGLEQLAVIDLFGNVKTRLSNHAFSDHDPFVSPDDAWVYLERFERAAIWNADWNLTNSTPWTIRMLSLDGSRERVLVDDGLVNWLPVEGPDGTVLYIKNIAFNGTELRMTDRFGVDRGRFLPDQGRVRYMDWK